MHHEPTARRIRARKGDATVIDTTAALVVREPGKAGSLFAVPLADVAPGALDDAAVWRHPDADRLPAGYAGLVWDAFDAWFEEDAEVFVHPRHAHRVDALRSSRHVRVTLGDRVLAESRRTVIAFEGTQPLRFYFPPPDVDTAALVPNTTNLTTGCPYKGWASYWDLADGGQTIAWTYADPLPEVASIAGRIAFFNEHVAIEVDGEPLERPLTQRSSGSPDERQGRVVARPVLRAVRGGVRELPGWRTEPSRRWVRGFRDDRALVDSQRAVLVWAPGESVPVYAFPEADVHTDALWFARRVDPLPGHVTFGRFVGSGLDRWLEEDEEVFVHPRDPHVRVDALPSSRHVTVTAPNGDLLAESKNPVLVFETGLPTRYYLPAGDVDTERLTASTRRTECPYKGRAVYWSAPGLPDVVWSYPDPLPAQGALAGLLAFYDERVDVTVDGVAPVDRRECAGAHLRQG